MRNPNELTRRSFIKTTAAATLAPGAVSVPAAQKSTKWRVGCRDALLRQVDRADCWAALKALGAECFEAQVNDSLELVNLIAPGAKYAVDTAQGIAALGTALRANGVRIAAFAMNNQFELRADKEIEMTTRLAKAADRLGVPAIRIDVAPRKLSNAEFLPVAVEACRRLCEATRGSKVRFGIENHGRFTNDPDQMEKVIAGSGSARLGITLDTANLYWFGHPLDRVYEIYQRFAPRVVHTHCKSIRYPDDKKNAQREMGWEYSKYSCPIYDGDLDFQRIAGILRKARYQGALCVENESLGRFPEAERPECLKKEIAFLRKLA